MALPAFSFYYVRGILVSPTSGEGLVSQRKLTKSAYIILDKPPSRNNLGPKAQVPLPSRERVHQRPNFLPVPSSPLHGTGVIPLGVTT